MQFQKLLKNLLADISKTFDVLVIGQGQQDGLTNVLVLDSP